MKTYLCSRLGLALALTTLGSLSSFAGLSSVPQLDASTLKPLGMNVGDFNRFTTPYFANAVAQGESWRAFTNSEFGEEIAHFGQPNFNANGYPTQLPAGKKLRLIIFGLQTENGSLRPASWPVRDSVLAEGKILVTWQGNADIRLSGGTFIAGESSGAATGSLLNGRRMYLQTNATDNSTLTIEEIVTPITEIKAWLPDPADPQNATLEGQLFHPTFLSRLTELGSGLGFLRLMDWVKTNASPQRDWSDRRLPNYVIQTGILNTRDPTDEFAGSVGDRDTGVAFEHIVALCNAANKDLWINIPHLATDDYITKLAQLIRFGSDGVNPFTSTQVSPAFAPLNPGLRVYVEYSNEIWSNGFSFPQGNWAEAKAAQQSLTRPVFNARKFCNAWKLFDQVFAGQLTTGASPQPRLIRVAAVFTGNITYTTDLLNEMKTFGPTLTPAQEPDLIAPTTYFGNGIQDFAFLRAQQQAGTSDPWFLTTTVFDNDPSPSATDLRPVSVPANSTYWAGSAVPAHLAETFNEWKLRMLAGSAQTGTGPDATGVGGGFTDELRTLAQTEYATPKPIVTYEGGPSLFTDSMDGGDIRDDGITTFMELVNRQPQMADIYRIHLNQALAKGLRTHTPYVEAGGWGRFGQWGHLESIRQPTNSSPKWKFLLDWETEVAGLRPIDNVLGTAPAFVNAAKLPTAIFGTPYTSTITTSGGNGARTVEIIGSVVTDGLGVAAVSGSPDQMRVSGTPTSTGDSFVFLRVKDNDGDPAWRTFRFKTVGGPNVLVESNFEGTNPSATLPVTPTYVNNVVTYSGWNIGSGITAASGDDGLAFSQDMPANEVDATLTQAITDNEFLTLSLQGSGAQPLNLRRAELRFTILRTGFHAPRSFAVMSNVGGFSAANALFTSPRIDDDAGDQEFSFTLPDSVAFENLTSAVEFRVYGFAGRFTGHVAVLRAFKITEASGGSAGTVSLGGSLFPVNESDGFISIPITRTGGSAGTVTVNVSTSSVGGTATAGADYTPLSNQLVTFTNGQTDAQQSIIILPGNASNEANETFTVKLTAGTATLGSITTATVRIVDAGDSLPPSAPVVTSPAANARVGLEAATSLLISGTATDNKGISSVEINVNGTGFTTAPLTSLAGTKATWEKSITPISGPNVIVVRCTDTSSHISAETTQGFVVMRKLLASLSGGSGTLTAGFAPSSFREIGKLYTITATPAVGSLFTSWSVTGGPSLAQLGVSAEALQQPTLSFIYREGLQLTANLAANPFNASVSGIYNALVQADPTLPDRAPTGPSSEDGTTPDNSTEGFLTLTVKPTGAFTGSLSIDGMKLPIVGTFDATGAARFGSSRARLLSLTRKGKPSLALVLNLNASALASTISGTLQEMGASGIEKASIIRGEWDLYNGTTRSVPGSLLNPGSTSGRYTVMFPHQPVSSQPAGTTTADYPQGDGFATLTLSKAGAINLAGSLADGTAVTAAGKLGAGNEWRMFGVLYGKRGFISSKVSFDAGQIDSDFSASTVLWVRPVQDIQHYPAGWPQGIKTALVGALYNVTAGQSVITGLPPAVAIGNANLRFRDGLLAVDPLTKPVTISDADVFSHPTPVDNSYGLSITRNTGLFGGTFTPSGGTALSYKGAILQKGGNAGGFGFFLSATPKIKDYTGQAGSVFME